MNYSEESAHIVEAVQRAHNVLVLSHANPDADSIASILSFRDVFARGDRSVSLAIGSGTVPETLVHLSGLDAIQRVEDVNWDVFDLLVLLDCADEDRVGADVDTRISEFKRSCTVINIDHHVTNSRFGTVNLVDPDAAATCEILALLYQDLDVAFDSELATCLFTGIQGDTLGLRTPSTTGRTLEVSAFLLRSGADLDGIVDNLFRIRPFSTLKLWGQALSSAERMEQLVWTEITPEMLQSSGADESEGEGIVNFLAGTQGAKAAALLYQKPDGWRVSMRSLTDDVDVSQLAGLFGGGGHSRAAGCTITGDQSARDEFLRTISERVSTAPEPMSSEI